MQPLGELACVRADEPPSPPTERLSAGPQLNAIFALALLAAPSVRGCPMIISEACFKANGGDFFAGANDRPSQSPGGPRALLQPPRLEETRQVEGETILNCRPPPRIFRFRSLPCRKSFFPKSRAKSAFNYRFPVARACALVARNYRFSASRAPGVGSANSITPRAKRACSMRVSFGADVGRLSCLRSQKRTARSLTASTVARSRCVMPARVRAARNCRPVTRLILR